MIHRLWTWTRNALAAFGAAALVGLAWFHAVLWYEAHVAPPVVLARPPVSPAAAKVAAWIATPLVRLANQSQDAIVAQAPTVVTRWAVRWAYPHLVREIPAGVETGCDLALDRFGAMTLGDLTALVVEHQRAKGRDVHWSVLNAATRPAGVIRFP